MRLINAVESVRELIQYEIELDDYSKEAVLDSIFDFIEVCDSGHYTPNQKEHLHWLTDRRIELHSEEISQSAQLADLWFAVAHHFGLNFYIEASE